MVSDEVIRAGLRELGKFTGERTDVSDSVEAVSRRLSAGLTAAQSQRAALDHAAKRLGVSRSEVLCFQLLRQGHPVGDVSEYLKLSRREVEANSTLVRDKILELFPATPLPDLGIDLSRRSERSNLLGTEPPG
jgi:hypothetical protein